MTAMNYGTALSLLHTVSKSLTGTNSTILTSREGWNSGGQKYAKRTYSIHPRPDQPCQGGELRKYEVTHPGRCTQPHSPKPPDLWDYFPDGKLEAIAINLGNTLERKADFVEVLYSDDSPFRSGFGSRRAVRIEDGVLMFTDLNVDPTVLMSSIFAIRKYRPSVVSLADLMKEGLTANEAMFFIIANSGERILNGACGYHFSRTLSPRRFLECKPNDLSGGLFSKGADYNRTYIADVFGVRDKGKYAGFNLRNNQLGYDPSSVESVVKAFKEYLLSEMEKEPPLEPSDTAYLYRNEFGKVLPPPPYALEVNPSLASIEAETSEKAA